MKSPRVAFFGSPSFALPVLEAIRQNFEVVLVVTQPDKPVGRGLKMTPPAVAARATELGLPLIQPERLHRESFKQQFRESEADVAVTCAYGKLIRPSVLKIPKYGFLNTHTSLLPKLRGAAPIQWALINGEEVTGTTIMQTDEGLDTGPILLQEELPIQSEWTSLELSDALAEQASRLIVQALEEISTLSPVPQENEISTYAPLLTKADGYVRWQETAKQVVDRYRGVAAWPQTTVFLKGKRLKIKSLSVVAGEGEPGEVLSVKEEGITIACQEEAILIKHIQPESRKVMSAYAWASGANITPGKKLDLWEPTGS